MFDLNVDDVEKFNLCIAKLMDRTLLFYGGDILIGIGSMSN